MKYPGITWGEMEAVINKLGGEEGLRRFLRGELVISELVRRWREQDNVISFPLPPTDGTVGEAWIKRLEDKGFRISDFAKSLLRSPDFKPTSGVIYEIAVLKGIIFEDEDRITKKIRAEANRRNLNKPNAEVVCLLREALTDEELEAVGLRWIVVMHKSIKDSDGDPFFLGVSRSGGGLWLNAYYDRLDYIWGRDNGFAFVVSSVSA